jgi:hypothetical protein
MLSPEAGMHRFIWDLHHPPPDSVQHEYPISAIYHNTPRYPLGAAVLPGSYAVKLTVGGKSYTRTLAIKMDPRVKTSQAGLRQQFELESKIVEAMRRDYEALQQVRGVRQQLKSLKDRAAQSPLAGNISALEQKTAELEGSEEGSTFLSSAEGRSLTRLNVGLNALLGFVEGADAPPTTQQADMFNELQAALVAQLARWQEIKDKDMPALNLKLQALALPPLNLESAVEMGDRWHTPTKAAGDEEP